MGAMGAVTSYLKGDLGGVFSSLTGVGKKIMNTNSGAADRAKQMNTSPAGKSLILLDCLKDRGDLDTDLIIFALCVTDVISWSGCKDVQTSADATEAGKATGAMVSERVWWLATPRFRS